jgi:hypothetical protein
MRSISLFDRAPGYAVRGVLALWSILLWRHSEGKGSVSLLSAADGEKE